MNKYQVVKILGDGSFGQVLLANIKNSNAHSTDTRQVAIKKMKKTFKDWEECLRLRELKTLKRLNHINIIKLREVIKEKN
jgi:serine/threonine protein kinase